ncbi:Rmf/CrpP family protein [Streptomyces prunicolor]
MRVCPHRGDAVLRAAWVRGYAMARPLVDERV